MNDADFIDYILCASELADAMFYPEEISRILLLAGEPGAAQSWDREPRAARRRVSLHRVAKLARQRFESQQAWDYEPGQGVLDLGTPLTQ
jgi:hypothetical protein